MDKRIPLFLTVGSLAVGCTSMHGTDNPTSPPYFKEVTGKPKFEVKPGDILEVTHTQTCISGSGICWEVKNTRTGEWGFVSAEIMKRRHHVYEETEQEDKRGN